MKSFRFLTLFLCLSLTLSACTLPTTPTQLLSATDTSAASSPTQAAAAIATTTTDLPSVQITPTEFFKVIVPLGQFSFLSPTDAKVSVMGPHASASWDNLNLMVGIAYRANTVEAIDPISVVDLGILNEIGCQG
jgi:hypothetical protein